MSTSRARTDRNGRRFARHSALDTPPGLDIPRPVIESIFLRAAAGLDPLALDGLTGEAPLLGTPAEFRAWFEEAVPRKDWRGATKKVDGLTEDTLDTLLDVPPTAWLEVATELAAYAARRKKRRGA